MKRNQEHNIIAETNGDGGAELGGVAARPRKRPHRSRHHHIITANFNVRCRECGADIGDALHVNDLVVYCAECCPACARTAVEEPRPIRRFS